MPSLLREYEASLGDASLPPDPPFFLRAPQIPSTPEPGSLLSEFESLTSPISPIQTAKSTSLLNPPIKSPLPNQVDIPDDLPSLDRIARSDKGRKEEFEFFPRLFDKIYKDIITSGKTTGDILQGGAEAARNPLLTSILLHKQISERNANILDHASDAFESAKKNFRKGSWFMGSLDTLDYLLTPINETYKQYVTEPFQKELGIPPIVSDLGLLAFPLPRTPPQTLPKIRLFDPYLKREEPLFHGTRKEFRKFKQTADIGYHFSVNPNVARLFAASTGRDLPSSTLVKGYLNVKNPLIVEDLGNWNPTSILKEIDNSYTFQQGSITENLLRNSKVNELFDAQVNTLYKEFQTTIKEITKDNPNSDLVKPWMKRIDNVETFKGVYKAGFIDDDIRVVGFDDDLQDLFQFTQEALSAPEIVERFKKVRNNIREPMYQAIRSGLNERGYDSLAYANLAEKMKRPEWSFIIFDPEKQIVKPFFEKINLPPEASIKLNKVLTRYRGRTLPYFSQLNKDIWDLIQGRSAEYLDDLSAVSPTLKGIKESMQNPLLAYEVAGDDLAEGIRTARGIFQVTLDKAFNAPEVNRSRIRAKVPDQVNEEAAKGLRGLAFNQKYKGLVQNLRGLLDDSLVYGRNAGLDIAYHKNFFPRRYLVDDNNREDFVRLLQINGYKPERIEEVLLDIAENNGFSLVSRTIDDIPEQLLAKFTDNDTFRVLNEYINVITSSAEFHRRFSWWKKPNEKAETFAKIKAEAGRYDIDVRKADFDRIENILKAFTHKYHRVESIPIRKAIPFIKTYQYMRTMPFSALTNTLDVFGNTYYTKPEYIMKLIPQAIDQIFTNTVRAFNKRADKTELLEEYENFSGLVDEGTHAIVSEIFGTPQKLTKAAFKFNGLSSVTNFGRFMSFDHGRLYIEDRIKKVLVDATRRELYPDRVSKINMKRITRELVRLGIDVAPLIDRAKAIAPIVKNSPKEMDPLVRGVLDEMRDNIGRGSRRFADRLAFTPSAANRPLRVSGDVGSVISQLQSYFIQFSNTVFPQLKDDIITRWKDEPLEAVENTLRAATAMAVLTGMGYLVYNVKLIPKYAGNPPPDKDPKNMTGFDKFLIGASTSGVLGMGNTIPGVVSAVKYGASPGDVVLGPTLGQAFDLTESAARSYLKKDTDPLEK
ncbi:MAG: hypothetical protein ACREBU_00330, partial [Nitrososphaera sp.]